MKETFHDAGRVLRERRARGVLIAVALSVVGDGVARVGLLLRVHDSGAGSGALAGVLALYALPVILLAGVAGRLADLTNLRPVLIGSAMVQVLAALLLAWRVDLGSTAVGVGVLQTGFALANSAWVVALPRLVAPELAGSLVSVQQAAIGIATPVGATLGGIAFARYGAAAPFVIDAVSFLPLLGAALLVPQVGQRTTAAAGGLWRTVLPLDGLLALRQHRLLAVLTAAVLPFIIALESVNAVEVYLAKDVLGATSEQFGMAEAAAGVAAVAGALGAAVMSTTEQRARGIVTGLWLLALVQLAQGLAPRFLVYLAMAAAVGLVLGGINALIMALMVTATHPATRGRVVAFVGGAARTSTIVALAVGGLLGTALGPRGTFVTVGIVGLSIALTARRAVARHLLRSDEASGVAGAAH